MNAEALRELLEALAAGTLTVEQAHTQLSELPFRDLGYARVDTHRALRKGDAEVIYCAGKTPEQVAGIVGALDGAGQTILGTRATPAMFEAARAVAPGLEYDAEARCLYRRGADAPAGLGNMMVVCAGTSDLPVALEAARTAEVLGSRVETLFDVGVAGIHRLLAESERLRRCRAIVAVAGMEGALPSVVGGLAACPVVAVPTSVGYGAAFGGLAALLGMLNSCSSNVTVVNIDNGFGAGYVAHLINRQSAG